jgi:hypothetical protein
VHKTACASLKFKNYPLCRVIIDSENYGLSIRYNIRIVGRDSSVGRATRHWLDRPVWVLPVGKAAGAWRWPPTPSSTMVNERVELYILSLWAFGACSGVPHLLTSRSTVHLKKLTGFQLAKKLPAFYWTRRFITAFTSTRHPSPSWAPFTIQHPNLQSDIRTILRTENLLVSRLIKMWSADNENESESDANVMTKFSMVNWRKINTLLKFIHCMNQSLTEPHFTSQPDSIDLLFDIYMFVKRSIWTLSFYRQTVAILQTH